MKGWVYNTYWKEREERLEIICRVYKTATRKIKTGKFKDKKSVQKIHVNTLTYLCRLLSGRRNPSELAFFVD